MFSGYLCFGMVLGASSIVIKVSLQLTNPSLACFTETECVIYDPCKLQPKNEAGVIVLFGQLLQALASTLNRRLASVTGNMQPLSHTLFSPRFGVKIGYRTMFAHPCIGSLNEENEAR